MKTLRALAAANVLLVVAILASARPALAEGVDERIKTLESKLAKLKAQQMELRKEAEAAAAAMPNISYRPGGGLRIDAADQSWGMRFRHEFNVDWLWQEGNDGRRAGDFEMFLRRNRPYFTYFWDRGFYEYEFRLDVDADDATEIQRATFFVNFNQIHPWLPRMQFGIDNPALIGDYDRGSSSRFGTLELPIVRRNNGWNTGAHTGIGFLWERKPMVVTPGTWEFHYYWIINGMGRSDGDTDQSSNTDHALYLRFEPFARSKNKWINGLGMSWGVWFGNPDERNTTNSARRLRARTQLSPNRMTLFDSGNDIDRGLHTFIEPGLRYKVGPYTLMVSGGFDRWNTSNGRNSAAEKAGRPGEVGRIEGTFWKLINELYVWSPKGFLTGSPTTPRSLSITWSFERDDLSCGRPNCDETVTAGGAQFSRNRILVRELDFTFFIRPSLSVILGWQWYDASNVPTTTQPALGCSRNTNTVAGKSCDWHDVGLRFRWYY